MKGNRGPRPIEQGRVKLQVEEGGGGTAECKGWVGWDIELEYLSDLRTTLLLTYLSRPVVSLVRLSTSLCRKFANWGRGKLSEKGRMVLVLVFCCSVCMYVCR